MAPSMAPSGRPTRGRIMSSDSIFSRGPCWPGSTLERAVSPPPAWASEARLDRKSTRLNSSHSQISYAVFCLKKKKTKQHRHNRPAFHPDTAYLSDHGSSLFASSTEDHLTSIFDYDAPATRLFRSVAEPTFLS